MRTAGYTVYVITQSGSNRNTWRRYSSHFQNIQKDDSTEGEVDAEADTDGHRSEDNNNNSYDNNFIDVRDVLRSLQEAARETAKSEGMI